MRPKKPKKRLVSLQTTAQIQCQFCNEVFEIPIDRGANAEQHFEYDCEICCRPLEVHIQIRTDGVIDATTIRGQ